MRVERIQATRPSAAACAVEDGVRREPARLVLLATLLLAGLVAVRPAVGAGAEDPDCGDATPDVLHEAAAAPEPAASPAAAEPAREASSPHVTGTLQVRAAVQGGNGNDTLSTRLGLEWLAGRWAGGFSLELSNDQREGAFFGRDGVGSADLSERWISWSSRGKRHVELRLGTARGIAFGEGLVLGSPTFDGLELVADVAERQRTIVVAGRTESLDPDDLLDEPIGLFPGDEPLGSDGELAGVRHEIHRGTGTVGMNLLRANTAGAPAANLASVDWSFSRGIVDFGAEIAATQHGGMGAFARTTITPSEAWAVTVHARRYSRFLSPLDAAPRYEGLSSADEQDETGALVRVDFAPLERLSGSVSFDWSQGPDAPAPKATVRRDTRAVLRWAVSKRTSLAYGFEMEDLDRGRDGRVHSLLLTQSFERLGRLSARLSVDRAGKDPRDAFRVSWRVPIMARKVTLLFDATLRRERELTKEIQAGASVRLGSSSFLTCRVTVADDESESVDVTWYRRF